MSTLQLENPAPPDDVEVVRRIARGDSRALGELYDRYAALLLALARRVLNGQEEAEEVLQEVFLQVWRQAERYETQRSSVSTWLVLLTRSRAIDRLRSRQSRDRTLLGLEQEKPRTHTSATAAANVLDEQRKRRLSRELRALPEPQRQVLELSFYKGMSQTEIAAAVDIPLGTVKTRTLLAMRKLRKALDEDLKDLL